MRQILLNPAHKNFVTNDSNVVAASAVATSCNDCRWTWNIVYATAEGSSKSRAAVIKILKQNGLKVADTASSGELRELLTNQPTTYAKEHKSGGNSDAMWHLMSKFWASRTEIDSKGHGRKLYPSTKGEATSKRRPRQPSSRTLWQMGTDRLQKGNSFLDI